MEFFFNQTTNSKRGLISFLQAISSICGTPSPSTGEPHLHQRCMGSNRQHCDHIKICTQKGLCNIHKEVVVFNMGIF